MTVLREVEFASIEGYRPLVLDLYLPEAGHRPAPAIVYFHGGGWAAGTRRRFGRAFRDWNPTPVERLAAAGFSVATVDYRLSGEAPFPAALDDAKAAVRWVRAAAAEHGIDADRIVAWGESAGGHLAAMVGLTGTGDARVNAVVDWYGPTDLPSLAAQRLADSDANPDAPDSPESRFLGAPLPQVPELARTASPIHHVHPGAPPFHIRHGRADRVVPFAQSETFVAALEAAGVPVEFFPVDGCDHFWIGAPDLTEVFDTALHFAQRVSA